MNITVSGRELKQAFADTAPLIKKSETSKSIAMSYESNVLYLTVDAGIRYQKEITVKSVIDPVSTTLTVWYKDISEFLSSRNDVNISFSNFSVHIETPDFSTSLLASDAIITRLKPSKGETHNIDLDELELAIKKLTSTNIVSKSLQQSRPIVFDGEHAYVKYSTLWIKCKSSGLNSILSMEYAKNIMNFQPQYVVISEVLEFHKEGSVLVIPNSVSSPEKDFDKIANDTEALTTISTEGIFGVIQKLYRAIGNATVRVYVYTNGLEFVINTAKSKLTKTFNVTGESLCSFEAPLEFLLMCFNLIGDLGAEVKRKEHLICLSNKLLTILLSVD